MSTSLSDLESLLDQQDRIFALVDQLERRGHLDAIRAREWARGHGEGYREGHADAVRDTFSGNGASRRAEAAAWLSAALISEGWRPATEVQAEAEAAGIAPRTLQRLTPTMVDKERRSVGGRQCSMWRLRTSPTSPVLRPGLVQR